MLFVRGAVTTDSSPNLPSHSPRSNRFLAFADLTQAELAALEALMGETVRYSRDQVIRHEGDRPDVFILHKGWVAASAGFDDGDRQIVKVHMPGDLLGVPSMAYTAAADTLTALTDVTISRLAPQAFGRVFRDFPRLGMTFFLAAQEERLILMERLMSVGRRQGAQRLAAFLTHVYDRLRLIDPACPLAFELPMTLDQIGDVLGQHAVHVSRTLRRMEREGLIRREQKHVELLDLPALRKQAGFPPRVIVRNGPWMPALTDAD
jgi:CRP/FNR family transcriptional regulator, anaerobic regulatory protein